VTQEDLRQDIAVKKMDLVSLKPFFQIALSIRMYMNNLFYTTQKEEEK